jgi:hypothetical protein
MKDDIKFKFELKSYLNHLDSMDRKTMSVQELQKETTEMVVMMREIGLREYNKYFIGLSGKKINPELIRAGRSGFITALVALGYISQDEGIKMIINDLIKQSVNERYYTTKQSDKKS